MTFVVLATGDVGDRVARLAEEHAAFDQRRRVVRIEDVRYDSAAAAAVVLNARQETAVLLDEHRAMSEAWIEDAFVRAHREIR